MNCASCVRHVQQAALRLAGVRTCEVNLARGRAVVRLAAEAPPPEQVAAAIAAAGFPAELLPDESDSAAREEERVARQQPAGSAKGSTSH